MTRADRSITSRVRPRASHAFTLIELLAVVALIIVVLGIAVPAFSSMIRASERSLAENTLRVGVSVARDLAILNGRDSGLLIIREANGRTSLIPVVGVGTLDDAANNPFDGFDPADPENDPVVTRDVFAPANFASTLQMPRGWAIAGFAEPGTIDRELTPYEGFEGWYDSDAYGRNGTPAGTPDEVRDVGNWLLPETAYYDRTVQGDEGSEYTPRQSFMLRFESGTGALLKGGYPALVVDPRPSSQGRDVGTYPRWTRANRIEDAEAWANRVLVTQDFDGNTAVDDTDAELRLEIIGNFSNDTVLAGAVSRLAVFDEGQLLDGLGARGANAETGTVYSYDPASGGDPIAFDMNLFAGSAVIQDEQDVALAITRWIQGDTNFLQMGTFDSDADGDGSVYGDPEGGGAPADAPVARIFFVHPGTGDLTEVER